MYGLEKEKRQKFDFDLEVELKKYPERKKKIQEKIKKEKEELKKLLQAPKKPENFEDLGTLLHAYDALDHVIIKIK